MTIKQFLPRSLLGRSLIIIIMPVILLQLVSALVFYDRYWSTVTRRLSDALAGEIATVLGLMAGIEAVEDQQWIAELAAARMALRLEMLTDGVLSDRDFQPRGDLERILGRSMAQTIGRPFTLDMSAGSEKSIVVEVELQKGTARFTVDRERITDSTAIILLVWTVTTAIIVAIIAIIFMRNQISPIRRLAIAADNFGKGRDAPDFKPSGAREVRQAAAAFLAMRDRIQRQIRQRTEMLAGVSHDLRTPLTRMKLQLAMLRDDGPELHELKSDVNEMEHMIGDYLAFARSEGAEAPQPAEIGPLLLKVAHGARRNGAVIESVSESGIILPLRRNAFQRCLNNLVSNAAHHGSRIEIGATRLANSVEITVDDDGPGIAPEDREDVFKPFYRLDKSRNPDEAGTGLGLTIARDIVRSHGGDLTLDESPKGGLRARIRLPL